MVEAEQKIQEQEFRNLVRIGDRDIDGNTPVFMALTRIRGVSFMYSNAVCYVLNLDRYMKVGNLPQDVLVKIEDCMKQPAKYDIPSWLFNRKNDRYTGESLHLVATDLKLRKDFDIRALKLLRCYRGMRHSKGSKKVRGQRTRSTGRRGVAMGVKKKKEQPKASKKKE